MVHDKPIFWQRIVLIELDGPRERELVVTVTPKM
jgi:thiamine phosphate synthase YjbQ (UPF0047 family)